ncbi:MAG TPA: DUF459 domain-containing protein [Thermoleophilia bacterium]
MDERDRDRLPFGRRRRTAASALVAILVAFVLGVLLNAPAMKKTAMELPFGGQRSFRLALVSPVAGVSHWVFLDRPARLAAAALGKPDPGPAPVEVVVVKTRPTPRPTSASGRPLPKPAGKPLRKPYAGHPMRLYIAGDSMVGIPGMALVNLSRGTHVIKPLLDYHISSGLVRPDFFNWPAQLQRQVRSFRPEAAVVMWGANDNQGVQTSSGKIYEFGSGGWEKEYRKRVGDAIAILFDGGVRRIYWVGQPIMPESIYNRKISVMNDIFRSEAGKHPGVRYIDAYKVFSSGVGYSQYLRDDKGEMQQVREGDGEHLTYAGGMRLAKVVLAAIKADWFGTKKPGAGSASSSPKATPAP